MILAGAVAGTGETDIYVTIAIVWFSAWAGDSTSFMIGRRLGRGFIQRHGPKLRVTPERFEQVEGYFANHGGKTILIGRFIGLVRALAPFVAGSSGMAYRAFLPYSVLGTGLWAGTFCVLGYIGARSLEEIADKAGRGIFVFGLTVAVIVGIVVAVRFLRDAHNRKRIVDWMDARAPLRPLVALGRRVKPQARFLWNRITPGGLGLELTAMLAVLAVSVFVLVGFGSIVSDDPGPTPGDTAAADFVAEIKSDGLAEIAAAVTDLGTTSVTLLVALVAAVALAARRHWPELAVLLAAVVIVHIAVPVLKELIDRPRPVGGQVEQLGPAYPSGHAAFSVIYAWLALTFAIRLRPGWAGGTALIAAGVALTVVDRPLPRLSAAALAQRRQRRLGARRQRLCALRDRCARGDALTTESAA